MNNTYRILVPPSLNPPASASISSKEDSGLITIIIGSSYLVTQPTKGRDFEDYS